MKVTAMYWPQLMGLKVFEAFEQIIKYFYVYEMNKKFMIFSVNSSIIPLAF